MASSSNEITFTIRREDLSMTPGIYNILTIHDSIEKNDHYEVRFQDALNYITGAILGCKLHLFRTDPHVYTLISIGALLAAYFIPYSGMVLATLKLISIAISFFGIFTMVTDLKDRWQNIPNPYPALLNQLETLMTRLQEFKQQNTGKQIWITIPKEQDALAAVQ
jgi:hypothetical protein